MLLLLLLLLWVCIVFEVAQKHKTIAKVQVLFWNFGAAQLAKEGSAAGVAASVSEMCYNEPRL